MDSSCNQKFLPESDSTLSRQLEGESALEHISAAPAGMVDVRPAIGGVVCRLEETELPMKLD